MINPIDGVIGFFNPVAGVRRAQARQALGVVRAYEAARQRPTDDGWVSGSGGPNSEVGGGLVLMRNRARQLVRDNPYAKRMIDILAAHEIGAGIVSQANTGDSVVDDAQQAAWRAWAETTQCDADGRTNIYGLQCQIDVARHESGEVLVRLRKRSRADAKRLGLTVPLQLQVIEADYLDHTKNGPVEGGGYIVQGVEFNKRGQRVAYWIFKEHPGETYQHAIGNNISPMRIDAGEIIHVFKKQRPGQVRGVTTLHPVMMALRDLQDYHGALLMKAKVEACFSAFVRGSGGNPLTGEVKQGSSSLAKQETLQPGSIFYVDDAEDVEFANPTNSDAHILLSQTYLRSIAVGGGVTHDQLTGDLTGANYSSLRAGKIDFRRLVEQWQWSGFIPQFCEPVWRAFVQTGELAGLWEAAPIVAEHTPPGHEMIDPTKDTTALLQNVRAGFKSWPQAVREMGANPKTQASEIAAANKLFDDGGLVLDIDPRKVSRAGLTQARPDGTVLPPTNVED
ncbi:phage portal protein [Thalassospira marina]|uniref:Phage portal protein n=1 Tax=Thalassospira marina TaxID=2048283 RepID=A0A2N3KV80_9PROT|nr:phage portal protein [Thalassospira marina]PKR54410.1 phage portal protein [Thalassospira marina]